MFVTVCLLAIIVTYYAIIWTRKNLKKENGKLPAICPGYLPLIGHAHLFAGDTIHLMKKMQELINLSFQSDGIVTVYLGKWTIHVMTDPEDSHLVMTTCLDKDAVYDLAKSLLGEGLVTAPVDIWKGHRKLLNPAFSQYVLDGYLTVFNDQSRKLADVLEVEAGKDYFSHEPYISKSALETICLTAMGIDDNNIRQNDKYMTAVNDYFDNLVLRFQNAWMQSDFLYSLSGRKKKEDDLIKVLHDVSNEVIQKRKAKLVERGSTDLAHLPNRFKSFLDLLLEMSMDGSLTDAEIRQEVVTMIIAGYDTVSTLMTIALVVIGSYHEVQEKIWKELQEVFGNTERDVTKQDLPKLVYLEAVIKEVLRLYPVVPLVARSLKRDVQLKNYTLSAGSSCFFLIQGIHTHPVWGVDRLVFRPERRLNPEGLPKNTLFAAFNVGKRNCIGHKFALMSAKTTLCHLLRRYSVTGDHTKLAFKMDVMLKPYQGHFIKLRKRSKLLH